MIIASGATHHAGMDYKRDDTSLQATCCIIINKQLVLKIIHTKRQENRLQVHSPGWGAENSLMRGMINGIY